MLEATDTQLVEEFRQLLLFPKDSNKVHYLDEDRALRYMQGLSDKARSKNKRIAYPFFSFARNGQITKRDDPTFNALALRGQQVGRDALKKTVTSVKMFPVQVGYTGIVWCLGQSEVNRFVKILYPHMFIHYKFSVDVS